MRSERIVDSRLYIAHNLDHSLRANSLILTNLAYQGHLANQLLLYDSIAIPTKDFGIIPILIQWLGLRGFEKALKSGIFFFLHRPTLLGYVGNGNGISGFTIQPGDNRNFDWWQQALFGPMSIAIDLQLRHMCPYINRKQRYGLVDAIVSKTRSVQYDNDDFMKHIVHESYSDIMNSPELSAQISVMSGNPSQLDLTSLPGIEPDQLKVINIDAIAEPADIVLRVAELNMSILMANQLDGADVFIPKGGEIILRSKLGRVNVSAPAIETFLSLLELESMPDPGAAIISGDRTLEEILKLRKRRNSRLFRKWLRNSDTGNARELEKLYVSSLGKKSFYERLPVRGLRFVLTKAADIIQPGIGTALEVVDSFFVEKWIKGYTPKLFLDDLRKFHQ